jgi:prepilin-type processing-associated H-X9-DG protein
LHTAALPSTFDDGLTKTYLVGEKMLDPNAYETGTSPGDNESLFTGFTNDLHRYAGNIKDTSPWMGPLPDGNESVEPRGYHRFGSAHASGLNMAFCDGGVRFMDFDVDDEIHFRSGHRRDGGSPIEALK